MSKRVVSQLFAEVSSDSHWLPEGISELVVVLVDPPDPVDPLEVTLETPELADVVPRSLFNRFCSKRRSVGWVGVLLVITATELTTSPFCRPWIFGASCLEEGSGRRPGLPPCHDSPSTS